MVTTGDNIVQLKFTKKVELNNLTHKTNMRGDGYVNCLDEGGRVEILSQSICISSHHDVHFKYVQLYLLNIPE